MSVSSWCATRASTRSRSPGPRRPAAQVALACAAGLKQVSLELGGKSAAIVLDDADPVAVATGDSDGQPGQQRPGLQRAESDPGAGGPQGRVRRRVGGRMASMTVGDPVDPNTQIGPLVAQRQQERVRGYIEAGTSEGARLVTGGTDMPDGLDTRLVRAADAVQRCGQRHADCPRGDLRARADRHPLR